MPINKKALLKAVGIGTAVSLGVILLLLCVVCGILMLTHSIPIGSLSYIVLIPVAIGVFLGGYIAAMIAGSKGLITGLCCAGAVFLCLFLIGLCSGSGEIGVMTAARLLTAAVFGALGGIKGVNRKEKLHIK